MLCTRLSSQSILKFGLDNYFNSLTILTDTIVIIAYKENIERVMSVLPVTYFSIENVI